MWSTTVVTILAMLSVGGMLHVLVLQDCQRALLEIADLNAPFALSDVYSEKTWSWLTVGLRLCLQMTGITIMFLKELRE